MCKEKDGENVVFSGFCEESMVLLRVPARGQRRTRLELTELSSGFWASS